ncbi:carboxylesterase [Xylariaceae sp. FL0662B]|nr:carboxylesterase [Xylariaceae sp. FL0662B]
MYYHSPAPFLHAIPLLALAGSTQGTWTIGQTVRTSSGNVEGHPAEWASEVSEYLGIPFAKPPVGELRWQAPQPYVSNGTIDGTSSGNQCPHPAEDPGYADAEALARANVTDVGVKIIVGDGGANDTQSEDCLTLNVWTKPQTGAEAKKAVILYVHGGGFKSGGNASPYQTGAYFADEEDVVFVSTNYRLGIFGFPGHPDPNAVPYNLGLMDQRLAMEWVRDNIAAFGGDADRITLFGSSAGAASVDYHSYAYADDPIAAAYIAASGTATSFTPMTPAEGAKRWANVSATVGCGDDLAAPGEVLACMMAKTADEIIAAVPPPSGLSAATSSFTATVDEKLVFADYGSRTPAQRPVLVGSNSDEGNWFRVSAALQGKSYPGLVWKTVTETIFTCPAARRAQAAVNIGVPVWRYRYAGAFPNTEITRAPPSGAYHGSQNYVLFGNAELTGPADTPAEKEVEKFFRGAHAAFAKDPVRGLVTAYGWPGYRADEESLMVIAEGNTTSRVVLGKKYDTWCPLS